MLFDWITIERGYAGPAVRAVLPIYNEFACAEPSPELTVGEGFGDLARILYGYHGEPEPLVHEQAFSLPGAVHGGRVLVGFSGGLDSAYQAISMRDAGWDVELFHVAGLNGRYPDEDLFARRFAEAAGIPYTECRVHAKPQRFPDNPAKNQLVMSIMADWGLGRGIGDYAMGADWCTPLSESKVGFTVTDSVEVNEAYVRGMRAHSDIAYHFIPSDMKKVGRVAALRDAGLLEHVYSCIGPHRFRGRLRATNERKYGVRLLPGRCGSCFKCCMESLLLHELGEEMPEAYLTHCWDVLGGSSLSHAADMFGRGVPLQRRRELLLRYGS